MTLKIFLSQALKGCDSVSKVRCEDDLWYVRRSMKVQTVSQVWMISRQLCVLCCPQKWPRYAPRCLERSGDLPATECCPHNDVLHLHLAEFLSRGEFMLSLELMGVFFPPEEVGSFCPLRSSSSPQTRRGVQWLLMWLCVFWVSLWLCNGTTKNSDSFGSFTWHN